MRVAFDAERVEIPSPAPPAEAVADHLRQAGLRVVETASGEFREAFQNAAGREPPPGAVIPPLFAVDRDGKAGFFAVALWEGEGLRLDTLRFIGSHPDPPTRVFFVALGGEAARAEVEANPAALQMLRRVRESGGLLAAPRDPASAKLVEFLQVRGLVFQKGSHVYLTEQGNAIARRK